jgi:leader peptidase (prepilin peptidase) / N-methyltransferase
MAAWKRRSRLRLRLDCRKSGEAHVTFDWLVAIVLALFGLVFGSAVTALAYRLPRERSWVVGRSACPECGTQLRAMDLVPLFSFILVRGRCRHCGARIPARYPITEFLCALWAVLLYAHIGLGIDYVLLALWGFMLIALLWIDLEFQLLPDALTFPGTLIGVAAALQWPGGARHALLGVALGSGLLWLIAWTYWKLRKIEGMGGGDIKLAAMFGVVLGWKLTLLTLFLAALAGSLWGGILMLRRQGGGQTALPFGTLLAPAAMVAFLWGDVWVSTYFAVVFPR